MNISKESKDIRIQNNHSQDILKNLCFIKDNEIILNYVYFKNLATKDTYNCILTYITNNIDIILSQKTEFTIHVNMKSLTIIDIDKHKLFIQIISRYLKDKYPQKLEKCYIYNAPFLFAQIYSIVSMFIDKETQTKIEIVNK
jgi:hypothetical protein